MITDDDVKYVIVQAGGKGTRMGQYAQNRPKCLVPINDIPMIINTLNTYCLLYTSPSPRDRG